MHGSGDPGRRWTGCWLGLLLAVGAGCGDDGSGPREVPPPATVPVPDPVPDDCFTDPVAGLSELECEGLVFRINVPAPCLGAACGLIADVHGFGMTPGSQDQHSELVALGGDAGFIVLQPAAPNAGPSWRPSNDGQVVRLIERAIRVFHVLADRVHMTGYSQGGFMTWRCACDRADLFGSVAPLAAGTSDPLGGSSTSNGCFSQRIPSRELDVLYVHGTEDAVISFDGAAPAVEDARVAWNLDTEVPVAEDALHTWTRYENRRGTVLEFVAHDWETDFTAPVLGPLRGHCFPGSSESLGCGEDNALSWGEAVIAFFLAHPRDT